MQRPLGRARAVGRDAARRRARARAHGVRRRASTGTSKATFDPELVRGAARRRSTASASRRAATSAATASSQRRGACSSTRTTRAGSRRGLERRGVHRQRVEREAVHAQAAPPFMTSTLQQEASRKLRFTAQTTMRVAQRLYERGYITYMRTDSTTLSEPALTAARAQARELYGADYCPTQPRRYERKVKNAQEAHEAIRPPGDRSARRARSSASSTRDELALYELIWKRTVASQMEDARGPDGLGPLGGDVDRRRGRGVRRVGHGDHVPRLPAAYEEGRDEPTTATTTTSAACRRSPRATRSTLRELEPQGHETTPPPRYTEATLVKALEERGIGRPSTYASIIGTILDRGYVVKKGTALVPSFLAFAVVDAARAALRAARRLRLHRADGGRPRPHRRRRRGARRRGCTRFYFGNGTATTGLHELVTEHLGEIDARDDQLDRARQRHRRAGRPLRAVPRARRAARDVPDDLAPDELTRREGRGAARAADAATACSASTPRPAATIVARDRPLRPVRHRGARRRARRRSRGRRRSSSRCRSRRSRSTTRCGCCRCRASSASTRRRRGDRSAQNGRYGPYMKKGERVALARERGAAVHDHARRGARRCSPQPKQRRGARPGRQPPLAELGADPASGKPIVVKDGPLRAVRHRRRDEREPPRRATTSRRSRSSARRSCSPTGARGARRSGQTRARTPVRKRT